MVNQAGYGRYYTKNAAVPLSLLQRQFLGCAIPSEKLFVGLNRRC